VTRKGPDFSQGPAAPSERGPFAGRRLRVVGPRRAERVGVVAARQWAYPSFNELFFVGALDEAALSGECCLGKRGWL
jgi:hypothetical protein